MMAIQADKRGTARAKPNPTKSYDCFITGLPSSIVTLFAFDEESGGKKAGGLDMTTTPDKRIHPMNIL